MANPLSSAILVQFEAVGERKHLVPLVDGRIRVDTLQSHLGSVPAGVNGRFVEVVLVDPYGDCDVGPLHFKAGLSEKQFEPSTVVRLR
jgi:hypothetical protein